MQEKSEKGNGPLPVNGLKAMVLKFQKISSLNVQPGGGQKPIPQDTIKEVPIAIVDILQDNTLVTSSTREVDQNLDMHYSMA